MVIKISKNRLVVPEAREAFEKYKLEIANEFGLGNPNNLYCIYLFGSSFFLYHSYLLNPGHPS